MAAGTNTVSGTIQASDSASTNVTTRAIPAITLASATQGNWYESFTVNNSATTVTIPSKVFNLYIRNLNAFGGGTIQITATPQGGASAILGIIGPGDIFVSWNTNGGLTNVGYTALSLLGSVAGLAEMFIGTTV